MLMSKDLEQSSLSDSPMADKRKNTIPMLKQDRGGGRGVPSSSSNNNEEERLVRDSSVSDLPPVPFLGDAGATASTHSNKTKCAAALSKKKKSSGEEKEDKKVHNPRPADVLLGRGKPFQSHPGNQRMLHLVDEYRGRYLQSERREKHAIVEGVMKSIKDNGGRFLIRVDYENYWVEVTHSIAYRKVGHAFRSKARRSADNNNTVACTSSAAFSVITSQQKTEGESTTASTSNNTTTKALVAADTSTNRHQTPITTTPGAGATIMENANMAATRRMAESRHSLLLSGVSGELAGGGGNVPPTTPFSTSTAFRTTAGAQSSVLPPLSTIGLSTSPRHGSLQTSFGGEINHRTALSASQRLNDLHQLSPSLRLAAGGGGASSLVGGVGGASGILPSQIHMLPGLSSNFLFGSNNINHNAALGGIMGGSSSAVDPATALMLRQQQQQHEFLIRQQQYLNSGAGVGAGNMMMHLGGGGVGGHQSTAFQQHGELARQMQLIQSLRRQQQANQQQRGGDFQQGRSGTQRYLPYF